MYDNQGWCIALYLNDGIHRQIQQRVLHYYQFRENCHYLNAWRINSFTHWWRKYKDKGRAKAVLHKIVKECHEVKAGFIFRSDDFSNEEYFLWKDSVINKVYCETFRENYKRILSAQLGIEWRNLND